MGQPRTLRNYTVALLTAMMLLALLAACTRQSAATPEAVVTEVAPAATDAPVEEEASAEESEATDEAVEEAASEEPTGDQATLVVQLDGSRAVVREVDFTAPISGLALLEQSGLDVVTASFDWGTAVCSIEGVGCPAEDCFCNDDTFWSYLTWQDESWVGYPVGPTQSVISETGAIEGWLWGNGTTTPIDPARAQAVQDALAWVRSQQADDGSIAGSISASAETLMSIGANHEDAATWQTAPDAPSLLDFVLENGAEFSQDGVSEAGKLAVALSAVDACWPAEAVKPSDYYSPTLGALHTDAGPLSWGILGAIALDEPTPQESIDYLIDLALPEGGWEWSPGWGRDTNATALAVQALVAAGTSVTHSVIISGVAYLESAQSDEGGFSYDPNASWGNIADSNSTAYVLQALAAVGVDAPQEAIDFLLNVQGDDGALGWQTAQPSANLGSTQQAIPAFLGQPYPIQRVALPICE